MSSLFQFVDLDGAILNLIRKFANNTKMCNWCFQFSSKNTSISLEPLSRAWHKNWQPTYCQEGARPCWEVKNIHNSKVSSNFPLLSFFFFFLNIMHPYSYKQPVNIHYPSAFTVFFNVFCFPDIWVLHHHNTDMHNQLYMYKHVHMFPPYSNFIHFEKLLLDNRSKENAFSSTFKCIHQLCILSGRKGK